MTDNSLKIQVISKTPPYENYGGTTYLLDFLSYLHKQGCEIEYTIIKSTPNDTNPWYVIPTAFRKIVNMSARNNLRFKFILFRVKPLKDWFLIVPKLFSYFLPNKIKNALLSSIKIWYKSNFKADNNINNQTTDTLPIEEELAFVAAEFNRFQPDIVIANYAWVASVLDILPVQSSAVKVILTHDVLHQRVENFKRLGQASGHVDWDCETESTQLRKADMLLAIQEEDAKIFKKMVPKCEVICMPMAAKSVAKHSSQIRGCCLFVGSDSPHNIHGLQWFLENVWSLIIEQAPHSNLHVCGAVCQHIQGSFPNVSFLGKVDDLSFEHRAAEVCIVPLLAGSGLKIKLIEALSYGRACVATSIGAQGLQEIKDKAILVADTPDDFANAMCKILTNPEKRIYMEHEAHQYVSKRLSPESVYQPFIERIYQHIQRQLDLKEKSLDC